MNQTTRPSLPRLAGLGIALLLGCACVLPGPHGRVAVVAPVPMVGFTYVDRDPPPHRYETIPPRPSVDHVWISGYWRWNVNAYIWIPGHYLLRPRPGARWVDGRWQRHPRHGWYWKDGRWH